MATPARFPDAYQPDGGGANLADILERVLDKGIVIAGDIRINLLDIELLTIKLRLVVASIDKAKEMGIDWWEDDPSLSTGARRRELARENDELKARVAALEASRAAEEATPAARREAVTAEESKDGEDR
ncbi:gas vesicle protein [Streptomyces sp. NPDC048111]|uniref:gas vesicle protein n=1 Tax=Streptomyces sp. NPDC048111 TaxID=3365500 RepID=UPI0037181B0A